METIEVGRASRIVTITLNRPAKKNAANAQMWPTYPAFVEKREPKFEGR